jgi:hypothetical protein
MAPAIFAHTIILSLALLRGHSGEPSGDSSDQPLMKMTSDPLSELCGQAEVCGLVLVVYYLMGMALTSCLA